MKLAMKCFLVLALVQLAAPAWMILGRERILAHGAQFKFRTAPVDPYDAFRGRYVALGLMPTAGLIAPGEKVRHGQRVCITLGEDAQGFATIESVSAQPPRDGIPWLYALVQYVSGVQATLELPFGRYYMEESQAPQAERAYRAASRRGVQEAWVTVRVLEGESALEELYVNGQPIRAWIKANPQQGS
jgi:uncharacterized membrane-anchored protein